MKKRRTRRAKERRGDFEKEMKEMRGRWRKGRGEVSKEEERRKRICLNEEQWSSPGFIRAFVQG